MKTRFIISFIASAAVLPLAPAFVHAQTHAALTGDLSGSAGLSAVRATGTAQAGADATVTDETPIVVTREDVGLAGTNAATTSASASSSLRAQANALAKTDMHVSSIRLSSNKVSISYTVPAKILGMIGISIPVELSVDASGTTSVRYPWYSFLLSTDRVGLAIRTEAVAREDLAHESPNATGGLSVAAQAHLLDSLHAILKDSASAALP